MTKRQLLGIVRSLSFDTWAFWHPALRGLPGFLGLRFQKLCRVPGPAAFAVGGTTRWTQASTSWPLCKTSVGLCWRIRGRSSSLNSGYPIKPLAGVTGFSVIVLLLGPQGFALGVAPKGTFGQNLHREPFWLDTFRNRNQRCRSWSLQTRFYRCVTSGL